MLPSKMIAQSTFQVMFDKLLTRMKNSDKVVEVSSHFTPEKELDFMFQYAWELEDVHKSIKISPVAPSKSDEKAENYRNKGNQFYKNKLLVKALECYNLSIMHCPQCEGNDSDKLTDQNNIPNNSEFKNLALGYANRSAVLFELKNYQCCLFDISRSIHHGYPLTSRPKLVERQAKCHLQLGELDKAKLALTEGLNSLKKLDLNKENIKNSQKSLETILKKIDSCDEMDTTDKKAKNKYKHLFNTEVPPVPDLSETNVEIPSLSRAVSLSYSPEAGRFLTASRDIMPGEILIREKGFGSVTLPASLTSHCNYCLARTFTPLPCPSCACVVFCSEDCRSKAFTEFHSIECSIYPHLLSLDMGKNPLLAIRLVNKVTLAKLKQKIPDYDRRTKGADVRRLGFNAENVYSSGDYEPVYHLVTNKERRTVSDLFKRAVMAVCLTKLLLQTKFFRCPDGGPTTAADPDPVNVGDTEPQLLAGINLAGRVLFTHLMNLPCNAHSLTEMVFDAASAQESRLEEVGAGAFGVLSLTNHSCDPGVGRACYGDTVLARAIRFIPRGAPICDSYGEHYGMRAKEDRQAALRQQYDFTCNCEACANSWSFYSALPDKTFVRCPDCAAFLLLTSHDSRCPKCTKPLAQIFVKTGEGEVISLDVLLSRMRGAHDAFSLSYQDVVKGDTEGRETLEGITNLVYFVSRFAFLPCKLLFEAQETLKHFFDRRGSHFNAVKSE